MKRSDVRTSGRLKREAVAADASADSSTSCSGRNVSAQCCTSTPSSILVSAPAFMFLRQERIEEGASQHSL